MPRFRAVREGVGVGVSVPEPGALRVVSVATTALMGVRSFDGVVRGLVSVVAADVDGVFVGVLTGEDVVTSGAGLARLFGDRAERRVCAGRARSR